MPAAYAIVQKELIVPELDRLKRAFSVSPLLTGIDAQTAANDAYGIVLRGQDLDQALALQEALQREHIETELVEESKLPTIPPAHVARQMEFHPTHLTIFDSMKRASEVAWQDLMFIAAGYVRMREVRKHRATLEEPASHAPGIAQDMLSGLTSREEQHHHLLLELFLKDRNIRYSAVADDFVFDHLGSRVSDDPAMNFVFLVQDLAEEAPHAGQNRGAFMACQRPPELFPYPSKAAFNEEIIWMLWRIGRMAAERGERPRT
jgi:hypothetical protein